MGEQIGFRFEGEVPIEVFEQAARDFRAFLEAIAAEAGPDRIDWIVADLRGGSMEATALGRSEAATAVPRAVELSERAFEALSSGNVIPFPSRVTEPLLHLTNLVAGPVTLIRLFTDDYVSPDINGPRMAVHGVDSVRSYGTIEGVVENLYRRSKSFLLIDRQFGSGVSCRFPQWQDSLMRSAWANPVRVRGWITREVETGRPRKLDVDRIVVEPSDIGDYRRARGVIPRSADEPRAEDVIRRIRDAQ